MVSNTWRNTYRACMPNINSLNLLNFDPRHDVRFVPARPFPMRHTRIRVLLLLFSAAEMFLAGPNFFDSPRSSLGKQQRRSTKYVKAGRTPTIKTLSNVYTCSIGCFPYNRPSCYQPRPSRTACSPFPSAATHSSVVSLPSTPALRTALPASLARL